MLSLLPLRARKSDNYRYRKVEMVAMKNDMALEELTTIKDEVRLFHSFIQYCDSNIGLFSIVAIVGRAIN